MLGPREGGTRVRERARQVLLAVTALIFLGIAAGSLVAPHRMARDLGYTLDNVDALNEFRAIYVGLWLAKAAFFVVAARRAADLPLLGDLGGMLLLGQTVGRLSSLILDGLPARPMIWTVLLVEAAGGIVVLLLRPRALAPARMKG